VVAAAVTLVVVRSVVPPSVLLPSVPSGWTRLTTINESQSSAATVTLHGVQLRICWAVQGSGVVSLSYEIGSPLAGSTAFYGTGTGSTGCVYDPGNDNDTEVFSVIESGIGHYAVSLDEQLSPAKEQALAQQQREQQAAQVQQQAQAAQQQAQQQAQAAQQQTDGAVDQDAGQVASDVQSVQSDTNTLAQAFSQATGDLGHEQKDLTATQQQAKHSENEGGGPRACGDADSAQGDADSVQGDADGIQGDLDAVGPATSQLQSAVTSLSGDDSTYNTAAASAGYQSADVPSSATIQSTLTAAQKALSAVQVETSQDTAQAQNLVNAANAAAQQATQAVC